jgi:hypothetical protein
MTIMSIMGGFRTLADDALKAIAMQISIWIWEARMGRRYGLDWSYKPGYGKDW